MHSAGIVHCNLKPSNVLLLPTTSNRRGYMCKLCGFSMSQVLDRQQGTFSSSQTFGVRCVKLALQHEHCMRTGRLA
jgi:serine/threonine protein kinase